MRTIAAFFLAAALLGAGCSRAALTDVTLSPGDTLVVRQTVLGVGGKLAELAGTSSGTREITVPSEWPTALTNVDDDAFVLLPRETYAELAETGTSRISLGLYDQTISDALGLAGRLNDLLAFIGSDVSVGDGTEDVLRVMVTDADATDWVRLDGTLVEVNAIRASNAFANYVILADSECPVILSLTLKPTARAKFDVLASFEGFEVAEIKTAGP